MATPERPPGAQPGPPGPSPGRFARRRLPLPFGGMHAWLDTVLTLMVIIGLTTVPLAVGTAVYSSQTRIAHTQSAERHQVTARLVTDAREFPQRARNGGPDLQNVRVSWTNERGGTATGTARVPTGTREGSEVRIWVNRSGSVTDPPLSRPSATATAWLTGSLMASLVIGAALGTRRVLVVLLDRRRYRHWEAEWEQVEPEWSGRARG
ncbi:Rv1733c family protein [Streptomyces telluris]|uniref:Proline rich protein membrane protein n=2 Tax=Streptomyces telluris TaxID=2720021 RepID=A0A9X2LFV8_9ACTN|nr:hypothetical protein [Streptomyces telluris]MCQ8770539.1 hypothetical protein [Streptomyces telluris]